MRLRILLRSLSTLPHPPPHLPAAPCPPPPQDPRKYARARELLILDEEFKKARSTLDDSEALKLVEEKEARKPE